MKLKYGNIADTVVLAGEIGKIKLPIRFSLKIAQGLRLAREAFRDFEEVKQNIVEEYGFRQINSNMPEEEQKEIEKHNEKIVPEINKKIIEALNQEIEINFQPIKLSEFKEEELTKLQDIGVNIMEAICWMWEL